MSELSDQLMTDLWRMSDNTDLPDEVREMAGLAAGYVTVLRVQIGEKFGEAEHLLDLVGTQGTELRRYRAMAQDMRDWADYLERGGMHDLLTKHGFRGESE